MAAIVIWHDNRGVASRVGEASSSSLMPAFVNDFHDGKPGFGRDTLDGAITVFNDSVSIGIRQSGRIGTYAPHYRIPVLNEIFGIVYNGSVETNGQIDVFSFMS